MPAQRLALVIRLLSILDSKATAHNNDHSIPVYNRMLGTL